MAAWIRSLGGWSEVVSMRRKGGDVKADERILGTGYFVNAVVKEAGDEAPAAVENQEFRQNRRCHH